MGFRQESDGSRRREDTRLVSETTPILLANYEASAAIRGKAGALPQLLKRLDRDGQRRLIRRLRVLQGPEISKFWDEFFGKDKEFGDFGTALDHGDLLLMISSGVPERVGQLIKLAFRS